MARDDTPDWLAPLQHAAAVSPLYIARPLQEFLDDHRRGAEVARLALFSLCEAVEATVRTLVIIASVDIVARAPGKRAPDWLARAAADNLVVPTFGKWVGVLREIARTGESPIVPELSKTVVILNDEIFAPRVEGERPERHNLIDVRNPIAHGSGINNAYAQELLDYWGPRVARLFRSMAWLEDLELWLRDIDGYKKLNGPNTDTAPEAAPGVLSPVLNVGDVAILRGAEFVILNPLGRRAAAYDPETRLSQFYVRQGAVGLIYGLFDSADALQAESGAHERQLFEAMFDIAAIRRTQAERPFHERGYDAEFEQEARGFVGRREALDTLWEAVIGRPRGIVYVSGAAGIGKSSLISRVAVDLRKEFDERRARGTSNEAILAYRFIDRDRGCAPLPFLRWLIERLARLVDKPTWLVKDQPLDGLRAIAVNLMRGAPQDRIVLVLDGLDELARSEPRFAASLIGHLAGEEKLLVLASSRPEGEIPAAMEANGAHQPWPDGLPGMSPIELREMLLALLPRAAKRLVMDDQVGADIPNQFVDAVVKRAEGLPLYVKLLVQATHEPDFTPDRLSSPRWLPMSVLGFFNRLVREGVLSGNRGYNRELVGALLALSHEPLSAAEIAAIITRGPGVRKRERMRARYAVDPLRQKVQLTDEILRDLGGLLKSAVDEAGTRRFRLLHDDLKSYIQNSEDFSDPCTDVRDWLAELAHDPGDDEAAYYLFRNGIVHIIEQTVDHAANALEAAERLADFDYQVARLTALQQNGGDGGIRDDWILVLGHTQLHSEAQRAWRHFWMTEGSRFEPGEGRDGAREFVECTLLFAPDTVVGRAGSKVLEQAGGSANEK